MEGTSDCLVALVYQTQDLFNRSHQPLRALDTEPKVPLSLLANAEAHEGLVSIDFSLQFDLQINPFNTELEAVLGCAADQLDHGHEEFLTLVPRIVRAGLLVVVGDAPCGAFAACFWIFHDFLVS